MSVGETVTVRMSRGDDNTPWGFRLQGGQEFGAPLVIGKVAQGSLADRAGLREGDLVAHLIGRSSANMKHNEAQDAIISAGNNLDLIVQRVATGSGGATIWKPAITTQMDQQAVSTNSAQLPATPPTHSPPVKVSLEHKKTETQYSGHNVAAKPFSTQMGTPKITHQQYNTPVNLYSSRTAADEYLHQTGGLFGTEPSLQKPKEEPAFIHSETLRLIRETEGHGHGGGQKSPRRSPAPGGHPHGPHSHLEEEPYGEGRAETLHHTEANTQSGSFKRLTHALHSEVEPEQFTFSPPSSPVSSLSLTSPKSSGSPRSPMFPMSPASPDAPKEAKDVELAKDEEPVENGSIDETDGSGQAGYRGKPSEIEPEGPPMCNGCGRHITGVFCKAGGKSLHADCFKCSTCGTSLKNIGYFLIHDKLYCEIHAKQHQQNQFTARPPQDPGTFMPRAPMPPQPKVATEPIKAFYQPEILKPGPVRSVSPGAQWKPHLSPISPSSRGVPGRPHMYASTGLTEELNAFSASAVNSAAGHQKAPPVVPLSSPPPPPPASTAPFVSPTVPTAPPPPPPPVSTVPEGEGTNEHKAQLQRDDTIELSFDESVGMNGNVERLEELQPDEAAPETQLQEHPSLTNAQQQAIANEADKKHDAAANNTELEAQKADEYKLPKLTKDYEKALGPPKKPTWHAPPRSRGIPPAKNFLWPPPSRPEKPIVPYWRIPSHPSNTFGSSADPEGYNIYHKYHHDYLNMVKFLKSEHVSEKNQKPPSPLRELMRRDAARSSLPSSSRNKKGRTDFQSKAQDDSAILPSVRKVVIHTQMPKQEFGVYYGKKKELTHKSDSVQEFVEEKMQEAADGLKRMDSIERRLDEAAVNLVHDACEAASENVGAEFIQASGTEASDGLQSQKTADAHMSISMTEMHDLTQNQQLNGQMESSLQHESKEIDESRGYDSMIQELVKVADNVALPSLESFQQTGRAFPVAQEKHIFSTPIHISFGSEKYMETTADSYSLLTRSGIRESNVVPAFAPSAFHQPPDTTATAAPHIDFSAPALVPGLGNEPPVVSGTTAESVTLGEGTGLFLGPAEIIASHIWKAEHGDEMTPFPSVGMGSKWTPSTEAGGRPAGSSQPRRGRGILKQMHEVPRIPICEHCKRDIRGPFVLAMGKSWCPDHFVCSNGQCRRKLLDIGFIEENSQIYCEYCFEQYFAPNCAKCFKSVTGDCLNALNRQWHPECFTCAHCNKAFGNTSFFLEDGKPYCEADWNALFTTKCVACKFPIEAGDRWVEALNSAYHSDCFTCTMCHKNLEGQSFYAKGGRPYCKAHA